MSAIDVIVAAGKAVIWMGAYSQLIGMPIAWLRLRRSGAWARRPEGERGIDLLERYLLLPTAASILWGWIVLLMAAAEVGLSSGAYLALILGAPAIFVPWAVLQMDARRLESG